MRKTDLYRHFDGEGNLLYIGVSYRAITRLQFHKWQSNWCEEIVHIQIEKFDSRKLALEAERKAIFEENPIHNKAIPPTVIKSDSVKTHRKKKFINLTLPPALLDRMEEWRLRQDVTPAKNAVVETAIEEFLNSRRELK